MPGAPGGAGRSSGAGPSVAPGVPAAAAAVPAPGAAGRGGLPPVPRGGGTGRCRPPCPRRRPRGAAWSRRGLRGLRPDRWRLCRWCRRACRGRWACRDWWACRDLRCRWVRRRSGERRSRPGRAWRPRRGRRPRGPPSRRCSRARRPWPPAPCRRFPRRRWGQPGCRRWDRHRRVRASSRLSEPSRPTGPSGPFFGWKSLPGRPARAVRRRAHPSRRARRNPGRPSPRGRNPHRRPCPGPWASACRSPGGHPGPSCGRLPRRSRRPGPRRRRGRPRRSPCPRPRASRRPSAGPPTGLRPGRAAVKRGPEQAAPASRAVRPGRSAAAATRRSSVCRTPVSRRTLPYALYRPLTPSAPPPGEDSRTGCSVPVSGSAFPHGGGGAPRVTGPGCRLRSGVRRPREYLRVSRVSRVRDGCGHRHGRRIDLGTDRRGPAVRAPASGWPGNGARP